MPVPDIPVRKLATVAIPAEPRLPSPPGDPAEIAARWSSASSDEGRVDIVLDVLAGIGLGVYAMDGTPIVLGAERGVEDPWLYDFEVALIARDPETVALTTVRDIAATLEGAVSTPSGQPVSGEQVADAVRTAIARALADPADDVGFPLRLARELELRSSGRDLADEVPVDQPLLSLAASLIALDLVLGLGGPQSDVVALALGGSPLVATGSSVAAAIRIVPGGSLALGQPKAARPRMTAAARTAQGCASITGAPGAGTRRAGGSGQELVRLASLVAAPAATVGRLLHANAIIRAVRPRFGADPKQIHYRHRSSQRSDVLAFGISVDVELPPGAADCGPLAGVRFPPPGVLLTQVPLTWDASTLAEHGDVTCGPDCATTGRGGWGELGFLAKVEPEPANLGPIQEVRTAVVVRADLGAVLGGIVPAMSFSGPVVISYHQPYEFDLFIHSTIRGSGPGRFVANAEGRVHIPDAAGSVTGRGTLKVRSKPAGRADGCKGEYTSNGSGTVDMVVYGLEVNDLTQQVTVYIDPGPELELPDRQTSPACGPKPKTVTGFSTWEHHFVLSHLRTLKKGSVGGTGGFPLTGWKWKADEQVFEQGGLLAQLDYRERCSKLVSCKGLTKFSLAIWPIKD